MTEKMKTKSTLRPVASAIVTIIGIMALFLIMPLPCTALHSSQFPDFQGKSIYETVDNVDRWVAYNPNGSGIVYEVHEFPQDPSETLFYKKGDCTDIALVSVMILREYGIQTRYMSGYADGNRHAWFEFKNESLDWTSVEKKYYKNLTVLKVGKLE